MYSRNPELNQSPGCNLQRAAGNAYHVADIASLRQPVRNAGVNNVAIFGAWHTRATSRSGWHW